FRQSAERTLRAFGSRLAHVPVAIPQMLVACEWLLAGPREIVIAGPEPAALVQTVQARFVPHKIVPVANDAETRERLAVSAPWIAAMQPIDGHAAAYVCRSYTCQLPVSEPVKFAELI